MSKIIIHYWDSSIGTRNIVFLIAWHVWVYHCFSWRSMGGTLSELVKLHFLRQFSKRPALLELEMFSSIYHVLNFSVERGNCFLCNPNSNSTLKNGEDSRTISLLLRHFWPGLKEQIVSSAIQTQTRHKSYTNSNHRDSFFIAWVLLGLLVFSLAPHGGVLL